MEPDSNSKTKSEQQRKFLTELSNRRQNWEPEWKCGMILDGAGEWKSGMILDGAGFKFQAEVGAGRKSFAELSNRRQHWEPDWNAE